MAQAHAEPSYAGPSSDDHPPDLFHDSSSVCGHGHFGPCLDDCHEGETNHLRYLPACSCGHAKEVISNSLMRVYVQMRGPSMGGIDDPLFEWIRLREELAILDPPPGHKKDVSRMLEMIDDALDPENPAGNSPRDAAFEIQRPYIQHIEASSDMDLEFHFEQEAAIDAFEATYEPDSDDEEAGIPSGRISPCTFLAWSRGCRRWDDDEIKETERRRPPTPEEPRPAKDRCPYWYYRDAIRQWDKYTGQELTPYYLVPTNPSIIYTPPGIPVSELPPSAGFIAKFSRMDPIAARKMRDHIYCKHPTYREPNTVSETYTFSEVQEVARQIPGTDFGERAPTTLTAYLATQWRTVAEAKTAEASLQATARAQERRIGELEFELGALRRLVPQLLERREARRRERRQQRLEREARGRRGRVKGHMATYLRDAQHEADLALLRLEKARRRARWNELAIERLEDEVGELLLGVGRTDVRQVYEEAHGVGGWERDADDDDGDVDVGAGAGFGAGGGVVPGGYGDGVDVGDDGVVSAEAEDHETADGDGGLKRGGQSKNGSSATDNDETMMRRSPRAEEPERPRSPKGKTPLRGRAHAVTCETVADMPNEEEGFAGQYQTWGGDS
ncbi:hypothetical protein DL764_001322 [Monosporascus ibericus]|uniref:Uncharacterized protein n=1 Tax=Monosporascus ibericus TaxID=155417 RepID=A0A4Q4TQ03_9PEZI|nr:hypothetical protein DL764_001322 [Monosporascus ibericus]